MLVLGDEGGVPSGAHESTAQNAAKDFPDSRKTCGGVDIIRPKVHSSLRTEGSRTWITRLGRDAENAEVAVRLQDKHVHERKMEQPAAGLGPM
eukprot:2941826-Pyramimonas_sp.AAC.1